MVLRTWFQYIGISLFLFPFTLSAEVLTAYYSQDSVRDIFADEISVQQAPEIVMQLPKIEKKKEEEKTKDSKDQTKKLKKTGKDLENSEEDSEKTLEQRLMEKYGNPLDEPVVAAVDNAPKPFKAMIEALQAGDKELAFKYGLQFTKYKSNLMAINQSAVSMIGQSLVKNGQLEADSWASSPEYAEDAYLRTLNLEQKLDEDKLPKKSLTEIIDQQNYFRDFSDAFIPSDSLALELDEKTERQIARQELQGRLPVDPKGQVDVYYFFEPNDREFWKIARDVDRLNEATLQDPSSNFVALTINRLVQSNLQKMQETTGVKFPVIGGQNLAKSMQISESPTVMFVNRSNNSHFQVSGLKNFYYIDEIRLMMKGV